jgi:CRP-like cAMP-binding protein
MPRSACDLSSCFLCTHCIPEWRELVSIRKTTFVFKKGQDIFHEGEEVKGMYFMYSGVVKVSKQWDEDKELILRFAKPGDVLGHRGLGGELIYPISATAINEAQVCFIPNDFLEATLKANPALTYQLLLVYALELNKAEKRMRDLAHRDVKGRIALAVLELIELFGLDEDNYISLPLSRQDLASFSGTTYETLFKFFAELSQNGILSTTGKNIQVKNPGLLEKYLES